MSMTHNIIRWSLVSFGAALLVIALWPWAVLAEKGVDSRKKIEKRKAAPRDIYFA